MGTRHYRKSGKYSKKKKEDAEVSDEENERREDMSNHAFNKLLTQRMKEKGIAFDDVRDQIESGYSYGAREFGVGRSERSLNGWLEAKRQRDWMRACGVDVDEWS